MQQTTPAPAVAQGAPMTESEFYRLRSQREELQSQLKTLTSRRNQLSEQRAVLQGDRSDHDARIKAIDQRSSQIDRELISLDVAIAKGGSQPLIRDIPRGPQGVAPTPVVATTVPPPPPVSSSPTDRLEFAIGSGAMIVLAAVGLWAGVKRFLLKPSPVSLEGQARRLEQLQQSVDVIAVEMERMSESQRYVAKVLNEKLPALGIGDAVGAKKG